jgi:hypothetical protein
MNEPQLPEEDIVLRRELDERPPVLAPVSAEIGEQAPVATRTRRGWLVGSALVLIAAAGIWYWQSQRAADPVGVPQAALPGDAELLPDRQATGTSALADAPEHDPSKTPSAEIEASAPNPVPDPETPLPALAESDAAALAALTEAGVTQALIGLLVDESLLTRLVVTVDNLPARKFGLRQRVLRKVDGAFMTEGAGEVLVISKANAARYEPLVGAVTALPAEALVMAYRRFYPLLQEAYVGLGYADRQFHARVIEVIDHLLAAEPAAQPVRLVQPKVFYRYADASLEGASVGHRALFRLESGQMARLQAWLKALRAALVGAAR